MSGPPPNNPPKSSSTGGGSAELVTRAGYTDLANQATCMKMNKDLKSLQRRVKKIGLICKRSVRDHVPLVTPLVARQKRKRATLAASERKNHSLLAALSMAIPPQPPTPPPMPPSPRIYVWSAPTELCNWYTNMDADEAALAAAQLAGPDPSEVAEDIKKF